MSKNIKSQSYKAFPGGGRGSLKAKCEKIFAFLKYKDEILSIDTKKAFTLAETLITLAIIASVFALVLGALNLKTLKQRELITRFNISFQKLDNMTGQALFTSQQHSGWSSDQLAFSNLKCTNDKGLEEPNLSQCLKKAYLSVSNIPQDLPGKATDHLKNFSKTLDQLKQIFPSLNITDMTAFQLPGSVTVALAYLDSSCNMDIPINRSRAGDVESVPGCGFLLVDVNGKKNPNNLLISKTEPVDRFLLALTPKGLIKSNLLDELAGCPDGTSYDSASHSCQKNFVCPSDMDYYNSIPFNDSTMSKQFPSGEEHPDCFEIRCLSGDPIDPVTKTCPRPCPNEGEKRAGGLWIKDGGDLPDTSEKACCVPIYNQGDLSAINNDTTSLSKDYCLMNDITFDRSGSGSTPTTGWTPIGTASNPFKGSFYGNGHIIKDLYINRSDLQYVGLFGYVNGTNKKIENLETRDMTITGAHQAGLIGYIRNYNLLNIAAQGNADGMSNVGGIAGFAYNNQIANIINNANVNNINNQDSNNPRAGGTIGYMWYGNAENMINTGNISSTSLGVNYIGGGIGSMDRGTVKNIINKGNINVSTSTGSLSAPYSGGGLGGLGRDSIASNIINYGNITGPTSGTSLNGGAIGVMFYGSAKNIMNSGDITNNSPSTASNTGGAIGAMSSDTTLANIINTGKVTDNSSSTSPKIGGIIGNVSAGTNVSNIINAGQVSGASTSSYLGAAFGSFAGGTISNLYNLAAGLSKMIGSASSTPANMFYLSGSLTGCTSANNLSGCTSKSQAELKNPAAYAGFDTLIWKLVQGFYPTLQPSIMPPNWQSDCRNNTDAYGGCYDVLNTPNAFDFNYIWAWKNPSKYGGQLEAPTFRWMCKPYRTDGYDCCRPSYAVNEPQLDVCPAGSQSEPDVDKKECRRSAGNRVIANAMSSGTGLWSGGMTIYWDNVQIYNWSVEGAPSQGNLFGPMMNVLQNGIIKGSYKYSFMQGTGSQILEQINNAQVCREPIN